LLDRDDFKVRLADTPARRRACSELVNTMYSWRGYDMQAGHERAPVNQTTLQVARDEEVIATLTICHDSDSGIPADALYKPEIDAYRTRGARVCELTRLAVDPEHRSKEVLGALFCNAHFHASVRAGATEAFIEVNPRHVGFYKRIMKFRQIGPEKNCPRVNAPAILLHQEVAVIGRQIAECAEQSRRDAESPQPYLALGGGRRSTAARQGAYAA
jgi:hypothetical protein